MKTFLPCKSAVMIALVIGFAPVAASGATLHVGTGDPPTELNIDSYPAFHTTDADVTGAQLIELTGPTFLIALWNESVGGGEPVPYYSFGDDGGSMSRARQASYVLKLVFENFDPLGGVPPVPASLTADPADELYIVQFLTQPLPRFREDIEGLSGTVRTTLPNNAHIVEMDDTTKGYVADLPYVRWIGEFHPAYRVEGYVREGIAGGTLPSHRYNVEVFERGLTQKTVVADRITALGGTVEVVPATGFLLQATLTPDQVESVTHWDEVAFLDRCGDVEVFMNYARVIGGADSGRRHYSGPPARLSDDALRGRRWGRGSQSARCLPGSRRWHVCPRLRGSHPDRFPMGSGGDDTAAPGGREDIRGSGGARPILDVVTF